MPAKKTRKKPHKRINTKYFQRLDLKGKDPHTRKEIRRNAIEWFRLESLLRAYSHVLDEIERLPPDLRNQISKDPLVADLIRINAGEHHWLIGLGTKPAIRSYQYLPKSLKQTFAVRRLNQKDDPIDWVLQEKRIGNEIISFDPQCEVKIIETAIRDILKELRSVQGRRRTTGGGRARSLTAMCEALQIYDEHKKRITEPMKTLGDPQTTDKVVHARLNLAREMIYSAKVGGSTWARAFPVD